MSGITPQPGQGNWLEHMNLIRNEYLVKETSLKDLLAILRARNFNTTRGKLEAQLRRWNFSKNLDPKTWQYIDRKINKRKQEGKESDVIYCGITLKKRKVTKETNRHRETNIFARFATPPPSPTNLQLSIRTPPALHMSSDWPSTLPWINLQSTFWNIKINATTSKDMASQNHEAEIAASLMMRMLALPAENPSVSILKLIAGPYALIPEWYSGQLGETIQSVLSGPSSKSIPECFKVMMYMISNSKLVPDPICMNFIFKLMRNGIRDIRGDLKRLQSQSPTIRAFLERLFQLALREVIPAPGSSKNHLSRSLDRVKWLLQIGVDPNCYSHILFGRFPATPIQQAVSDGLLRLVQLLLDFNSQPNLGQVKTCKAAFVNLALGARCSDVDKLRILNLLFDHSFLSNDDMLRAAIELGDTELMFRMLQYGPDVASYEAVWLPPARRWELTESFISPHFTYPSALMMAVQAGGRMADSMLEYIMLKSHTSPSILADAYIAAAYGGHYALTLRLGRIQPFGRVCNKEGITPLQAAVVGGNPILCKYLLERQGGSSTSLILAAAILGTVDIVQLLIEYGGDPNSALCTADNNWYGYFNIPQITEDASRTILTILMHWTYHDYSREEVCLVLVQNGATLCPGDVAELSRHCYHRCLEAALMAGGDPNDEDWSKQTALQCALDRSWSPIEDSQTSKRLSTVELLIQAGASLVGGEVVRAIDLQEMDVALFLLRHGGTLIDHDETGKGCFEAEISAQNDPFLREILEMHDFPIDAGPFCVAIQAENWDLVARLFGRAHTPDDCHLLEGTAVGLAAEAGQLGLINWLLTRFTHPSVLASAILPLRVVDGDIIKVERCRDGSGYWRTIGDEDRIEGSPLALAAIGGDASCLRELLRRGCRMDKITWAMIANTKRSSDCLEVLKEFCCALGTSRPYDSKFTSAMCKTIEAGKDDLLRYLVEVGADVNELDTSTALNRSPLQCALSKSNIDMASYLLENGAYINAPPAFDSGATALQFAIIGGHIGFARHLLQLGARVNMRGAAWCGRSALQAAAEHGKLDILALLVHHGAVTIGSGRQQLIIAVALAQKMAHHVAAEWLKENCGWSDADQHLLERYDKCDDYNRKECIGLYCCDEYHDNDTRCTYHYTEEQRKSHFEVCERCAEFRGVRGDGNESSSSSE